MHISFDLDLTIIPSNNEFETEKRSFFQKILGVEKIRKGTIKLFKYLKEQGHIISIYTTSHRNHYKIWFNFKTYGLTLHKIINQEDNSKKLKEINMYSSKYPPAFSFDVHIDDSKGVGMESEKFNFKSIIIDTNELNWCEKIKQEINKIVHKKQL